MLNNPKQADGCRFGNTLMNNDMNAVLL